MDVKIFVTLVLYFKCAQLQVSGECTSYYQIKEDTGRNGLGVDASAVTHQACLDTCNVNSACTGYGWDGTNCRIYITSEFNFVSKAGTTQYFKLLFCSGCVVIRYGGKGLKSGPIVTSTSAVECIDSCVNTPGCVAVDYDGTNCYKYTSTGDKHFADLPVQQGTHHFRIIFCVTPPPCNGPPLECSIDSHDACVLDGSCGIGSRNEVWSCAHGIPDHPALFQMTRDCCTDPCPAGAPCSHPQQAFCGAGTFITSTDCFNAGCCWVPDKCLEDSPKQTLFCEDVGPSCDP